MAKTIYFPSYEEFLKRKDKSLNGTNKQFQVTDNESSNEGCWNCVECNECIGCINCINCINCCHCTNCIESKNCYDCKRCIDCIECVSCKSCKSCNACKFVVDAIGRENHKKKMLISVTKLTNVDQFRKGNAFTMELSSKMTLADASTGKKIELKPKE